VLEDLGLADALRAECDRFVRLESIPVEIKLDGIPGGVPLEAGLCLFRVTQEALRNISRHSRARSATISVRPLDGGLQLAIADNGVGFDPGGHRRRQSLGVSSMRERVLLLGGELDIESSPGYGTTVVAWVPMKPKVP
jgi:signal transduction histidine kinase